MKKIEKNRIWVPVFILVSIAIWSIGLFAGNGDPIKIYGDPAVQNAFMPSFVTYDLVHYGAPIVSALGVIAITAYAWVTIGKKPALSMIFFGLFIAFIYEDMGIRTGWVFGPYYHTSLEGIKFGTVPLMVICSWALGIFISWSVTNLLLDGTPVQSNFSVSRNIYGAFVGAMVLTALDVGGDPFMAANKWWVWYEGGAFAGVPFHNYVGWMALGIVTLLVHNFDFGQQEKIDLTTAPKWKQTMTIIPVILYGIFWVFFTAVNPDGYLGLVVFFVVGIPFLLALKRWIDWYKAVRS